MKFTRRALLTASLIGAGTITFYLTSEKNIPRPESYTFSPEDMSLLEQSTRIYARTLKVIPEYKPYTESEKQEFRAFLKERNISPDSAQFPEISYSFSSVNSNLDKLERSLGNSDPAFSRFLSEKEKERMEIAIPAIYFIADQNPPDLVITRSEAATVGQALIDAKLIQFGAELKNYDQKTLAEGLGITEIELERRIKDYRRTYLRSKELPWSSSSLPDLEKTFKHLRKKD